MATLTSVLETDTSRRIRRERRGSILNEVATASAAQREQSDGSKTPEEQRDNVKSWLAQAMRLDHPSGGGGSVDAPARSLIGTWDMGSAASVRALRALPVQLMYAARYRDAASILTSLPYIEAMATTGNLFLVSDLLKSWLANANQVRKTAGGGGQQGGAATTPLSPESSILGATGFQTGAAGIHAQGSFHSQQSGLTGGLGTTSSGSVFLPERKQAPRRQDILRVVATSQFIAANAATIAELPQSLFQMAANLPSSHPLTKASDASWRLLSEGRSFFRHLNKPEQRDPCLATLSGHWAPVVAGQFDPSGA